MRKDLTLKINTTDSDSSIYENNLIGVEGENLQGRLILQLDKPIEGVGLLHVKFEDGLTMFITMNHNVDFSEYSILIKSSLLKYSNVQVQLEIRENETDDGIPKFKSAIYNLAISPTIVGTIEEPDEYPDWLDEANAKLKEIDDVLENLDEVIENSQTQSDWNQNDTSKSDYIKNRPFYEGSREIIVLEEKDRDFNIASGDSVIMYTYNFTEDEKLIIDSVFQEYTNYTLNIIFDGATYKQVYTLKEADEYHSSKYLSISYDENELPGFEFDFTNMSVVSPFISGGIHTIGIKSVGSSIVKIPEKFLPENVLKQSDWNQNDETQLDYIKNRPFYENNIRTENIITEAVEKVPEEIDTVMNYYYFTEDEKTIISNFLADKTEVTLKLRMNGNDYIFDCYLNDNGRWAYREQPVFGLDLNLNAFNIMCASTTGITGVQTVELIHISDGEIVTIPEKYMPLNYQGFEKRIKDLEEKLEKYTYLVLEEGKTNGTN